MIVLFAATSSYFDFVQGVLTAERGKTQRSEPVSTRNCIFDVMSVMKRRLEDEGQSLAATCDRPERFPI